MFKDVASQKIAVYAVTLSTGAAKTGDAANITAQISLDGGATAATDDANPTELDATDAPGIYLFDMTQAESNADLVVLYAKSSTSGVSLEPVVIYTVPATVDANVTQWKGQTAATVDTNGYPVVTIKDGTGQGELLTTSGKIDGTMQAGNVTVGDYDTGKSPADLVLATPANKLTTDASGNVTLKSGTHTGAVIPQVTLTDTATTVTNPVSVSGVSPNTTKTIEQVRQLSEKIKRILIDRGIWR